MWFEEERCLREHLYDRLILREFTINPIVKVGRSRLETIVGNLPGFNLGVQL